MNNKKLFQLVHSWEFTILLNYLIERCYFDYIEEGKTIDDLANHFGFVKEKNEAIADVLISYGLIQKDGNIVTLPEYSKKHLLTKSKFYIGSYINWRVQDFFHWQKNIGDVMTGKLKTVHGDFQYTEYTDKHKEALEGIVVACSRVYPIEELAIAVSKKTTLTGSLLDLGCGTGLWGITMQKYFADLKVILFDRETDFVNKTILEKGLVSDRLTVVKGDMFLPGSLPKVNNVLVANVFMDWDDKTVTSMIEKIVKECQPQKFVIHEFVNEKGIPYLADYNLFAQAETLGKIRSKDWWIEKLAPYFKNVDFIKLDFGSTAIIAM
jgi:hypothetical protein